MEKFPAFHDADEAPSARYVMLNHGIRGPNAVRRHPVDSHGRLAYWGCYVHEAGPAGSTDTIKRAKKRLSVPCFALSEAEIRFHPANYRTRLCPHGERCTEKASCPDAHSDGELRTELAGRYVYVREVCVAPALPKSCYGKNAKGDEGNATELKWRCSRLGSSRRMVTHPTRLRDIRPQRTMHVYEHIRSNDPAVMHFFFLPQISPWLRTPSLARLTKAQDTPGSFRRATRS